MNKQRHSDTNKKIKYYYHALPGGTVRGKNDSCEAYLSSTDQLSKDSERSKVSSNKKKHISYQINSYKYAGDQVDKNIEFK